MSETIGTDPGTGISGNTSNISGGSTGAIGMIMQITVPGLQAGEIDVSTMNTGKFLEHIASKIDPRTIELQLIYEKQNFAKVTAAVGGLNEVWTITLPDLSTYVQSGYIRESGFGAPQNDKITHNVTLRMSGAPVFTPGSGVPTGS